MIQMASEQGQLWSGLAGSTGSGSGDKKPRMKRSINQTKLSAMNCKHCNEDRKGMERWKSMIERTDQSDERVRRQRREGGESQRDRTKGKQNDGGHWNGNSAVGWCTHLVCLRQPW
jgi:hypothetical protein